MLRLNGVSASMLASANCITTDLSLLDCKSRSTELRDVGTHHAGIVSMLLASLCYAWMPQA